MGAIGKYAKGLSVALGACALIGTAAAGERCVIPLSGTAASGGFSEAGPFNSRADCQAALSSMPIVGQCVCTYTAPPQSYSPRPAPVMPAGPSPAEIARQRAAAELAAQQKADEERRAREAAAAQRRYLVERDAAPLKGLGNGTNAFGAPKGEAPASATIKDLKPATATRDLGGKNDRDAAWKKLNCAASITGYAVDALLKPQPDFDEFAYLSGQASSALAGDALGVECPTPPVMPKFASSPSFTPQRMEAVLARASSDADTLKTVQAQRKAALDDLIEAKKKLAELKGAGDAALREIAALQAQRQALGPLTLKPAPAPPPPGAKPKPEKPDLAALVAKAEREAKEAKERGDRAEQTSAATTVDLQRVGEAAHAVAKGQAEANDLMAALLDGK